MKIIVKFFGMLSEATGMKSVEFSGIADTGSLKIKLNRNYPKLKTCQYSIAINKNIVSGNTKLNNGDEIALLPPFAGG